MGLHDRPFAIPERAGLHEDLLGDGDLPDVVEERAELDRPAAARIDVQLVRGLDRERDHAAAVRPRVGVLVTDQVAEGAGRASVGVAELDQRLEPREPLSREDPEQEHQGGDQRHRPWVDGGGEGEPKSNGGEQGVHEVHPPELGDLLP